MFGAFFKDSGKFGTFQMLNVLSGIPVRMAFSTLSVRRACHGFSSHLADKDLHLSACLRSQIELRTNILCSFVRVDPRGCTKLQPVRDARHARLSSVL